MFNQKVLSRAWIVAHRPAIPAILMSALVTFDLKGALNDLKFNRSLSPQIWHYDLKC